MKKILLLFSLILIALTSFSQITLTPSKSTVASGEEFTVNASGENITAFIGSLNPNFLRPIEVSPKPAEGEIDGGPFTDVKNYNGSNILQTSFKCKLTNGTQLTDGTVKFYVSCNINSLTGLSPVTLNIPVIVIVEHALIGNEAKSGTYYKSCGSGYGSEPYTYTVPANKYKEKTLAEANAKADADLAANGQTLANANRTCKLLYYSDAMSGTFTKNNCPSTYEPGPAVTFSIPARAKTSFNSVAEANVFATQYLNVEGQNYANSNTECIEIRNGYLTTKRNSACDATGEVTAPIFLHNPDLSTIPAGAGASTGIIAYTASTGTTKAASGYYKGLYSPTTDGNYDRIYFIDFNGEITGYTLCQKPTTPTNPVGDAITVTCGRGFSSPGQPQVTSITLKAKTAYSVDVEITGGVIFYNSQSGVIGSASFTAILPAGQTLATEAINFTFPSGGKYRLTNVTANPTMDGTRSIVINAVSTF
ncbi:DUF5977 domain-containing protein [Mucilaginibacter galii]|uniref:DUF5977 domain-containing protein n=1 Tax=Mucilaginibacter galii TaxID=2005073 RepID=A0A917J870_9SPHI|nr:DUF5977 domain-containing protein [Mucilaginibacter galii]GGI50920.1 hypothetical protein GCM10011425_21320 [Mucilaginibacter galii]